MLYNLFLKVIIFIVLIIGYEFQMAEEGMLHWTNAIAIIFYIIGLSLMDKLEQN